MAGSAETCYFGQFVFRCSIPFNSETTNYYRGVSIGCPLLEERRRGFPRYYQKSHQTDQEVVYLYTVLYIHIRPPHMYGPALVMEGEHLQYIVSDHSHGELYYTVQCKVLFTFQKVNVSKSCPPWLFLQHSSLTFHNAK